MDGKKIAAIGIMGALVVGLVVMVARKVKETEPVPPTPPDPKVKAGPLGLGDIDGDGWVSVWDYDLCQQIRFGQGEFTDDQLRRADVNQDGEVSILDYSSIRLIMWGQLPAL